MKSSKAIFRQEALGDQQRRVCSKKSVQSGRSHFCARSVLPVIEENTETRAHERKCGWLRHHGGWFPYKRSTWLQESLLAIHRQTPHPLSFPQTNVSSRDCLFRC